MKNSKRQFIAVRFDIDLPLRLDQLVETIGLLEALTDIFRQALGQPPAPQDKEKA